MKIPPRQLLPVITSFAVFFLLIWLSVMVPPGRDTLLPSFMFLVLIVYCSIFSAPIAGGMASLTPMISVAGFLVIGLVPSGWLAFTAAVAHAVLRQNFSRQLGMQKEVYPGKAISMAAANITAKTTSILVGGVIYQYAGGAIPLVEVDVDLLLPLLLLLLTYFAFNDLIFGSYIAAWEARSFHQSRRWVYSSIIYEGGPLVFSPLIALIYTNLGTIYFFLVALAVMATASVTRNFANASFRLKRQLKGLESLHKVGQSLSDSLELNAILMAVYTHAVRLMPAESFYVALYDKEINEVSFPLAIEDGQPVQWSTRREGRDLTEYILRTRMPLFSRESTAVIRSRLELSKARRPATSWLGVPVIAGEELMGVIVVQSFSAYDLYDVTHQEILMTIATQAAVAIKNARMYEQTDEALKQRVQELDSILRTIEEGVILANLTFRILAVNRVLVSTIGVNKPELTGRSLLDFLPDKGTPLIKQIWYTEEELQKDCIEILNGGIEFKRQIISKSTPIEKRIERTLTPVRDLDDNITAWLFVLRDVTEEFELTRLREDMIHTLVHDLRSPLAIVRGCLEVIKFSVDDDRPENVDELLDLALIGSERMLRIINNLLDVSRLEEGKMVLATNWVSVEPLLKNAAKQIAHDAERVKITIEVSTEEDLPPIYVDQVHLERILNNLLDNAIKFTPDSGRIKLWARLDTEITPASILIGVSDTGPGVSEEIQSLLFQKFRQVEKVQGRRVGSGIGLYYCKLAVEAHGGQIWVESQLGSGSTFYVRFSLAQ